MSAVAFIFPHQLFERHPAFDHRLSRIYLIEDSLFFGDSQYPLRFHKQKLAYHRASMSEYAGLVSKRGFECELLNYQHPGSILLEHCQRLALDSVQSVYVAQLHDDVLEKRLRAACEKNALNLVELKSPGFINDSSQNREWRKSKKRWFMADFYQWQRKRLDILIDQQGKPEGGKWSFDDQNRKKIAKKLIPDLPQIPTLQVSDNVRTAFDSVQHQFADNPGSLDTCYYPTTHAEAKAWLTRFLQERFVDFGQYEDALLEGQSWLYHGVLTPMLNTGLLTPNQVVDAALKSAARYSVPINSVEGFIRQVIGWREFMRATYEDQGVKMRTGNHWKHERAMPSAFYTASTGIDPIDDVIRRALSTAYSHHIERLMVLGGFMFLCEIDPDDIYRWFMEMYIDSYDWVMVPNVYAMSQHADGGTITTKPYFSGSNYVLKMSNFQKGQWSVTWDGLFWRWIDKNQQSLAGNPRWAMMVKNVQRMDEQKLAAHHAAATEFLENLK